MSVPDPDLARSHEGLRRVLYDGAYADLWLRAQRARAASERLTVIERRLYGVLESLPHLDALLATWLRKPLRTLSPRVRVALTLGLWRLLEERGAPAHAVVDQAVAAAGRGAHASSLVNAVLRRAAREAHDAHARQLAAATPAFAAALPEWWAAALAPALASAELAPALRALRQDPGTFVVAHDASTAQALVAAGVAAMTAIDGCLRCVDPAAYFRLPPATAARTHVQDLSVAAWLTTMLATARAPLWDVFCAPGGKLLAAARAGMTPIVGSDRDAVRLGLLRREAGRTGLACPPLVAAAAAAPPWRHDLKFATILADAPCSASGTLMRHPEIALRLREEDVARLRQQQVEWLHSLLKWAAPGGTVWYSTCSLFPAENEEVVAAVLATVPGWRRVPLVHPLDGTSGEVLRFWPHRHGGAGFTAQRLVAPP